MAIMESCHATACFICWQHSTPIHAPRRTAENQRHISLHCQLVFEIAGYAALQKSVLLSAQISPICPALKWTGMSLLWSRGLQSILSVHVQQPTSHAKMLFGLETGYFMMILVFHSYPCWLTILHRHLGCLKICRASFPLGPCPEAPEGEKRRAGNWWDTVCSSADEVWPAASLSSDTSAAKASLDHPIPRTFAVKLVKSHGFASKKVRVLTAHFVCRRHQHLHPCSVKIHPNPSFNAAQFMIFDQHESQPSKTPDFHRCFPSFVPISIDFSNHVGMGQYL